MSERLYDDEKLAAFLEGRLDASERQAMLAHLAADPDAYDLLVSTAAILREAEDEGDADAGAAHAEDESRFAHGMRSAHPPEPDGDEPPVDEESPKPPEPDDGVIRLDDRRRMPTLGWIALAAVLAAVSVIGLGALRSRAQAGDPLRLAARLDHAGEGLPPDWTDSPWSTTRGPGGAETGVAGAARAGALLVDLAVAVQGRDSAETRLLAIQFRERFPRAGHGAALRKIADGAGSPPEQLNAPLAEVSDATEKRLGSDAVQVGAWTEAARLAASRQDAAFFRNGPTARMLDRASDSTTGAAVQKVRALVVKNPPQWDALVGALNDLASAIAKRG